MVSAPSAGAQSNRSPPCPAPLAQGFSPAPSTGGSPRRGIAFLLFSENRPMEGKVPVPIPGNVLADPTRPLRSPGNDLTDLVKIEYDSFQKAPSSKSFSPPDSPGTPGEVPGRFFIFHWEIFPRPS